MLIHADFTLCLSNPRLDTRTLLTFESLSKEISKAEQFEMFEFCRQVRWLCAGFSVLLVKEIVLFVKKEHKRSWTAFAFQPWGKKQLNAVRRINGVSSFKRGTDSPLISPLKRNFSSVWIVCRISQLLRNLRQSYVLGKLDRQHNRLRRKDCPQSVIFALCAAMCKFLGRKKYVGKRGHRRQLSSWSPLGE